MSTQRDIRACLEINRLILDIDGHICRNNGNVQRLMDWSDKLRDISKILELPPGLYPVCSDCNHGLHLAGECPNCNCGESERIKPKGARLLRHTRGRWKSNGGRRVPGHRPEW